MTKELRKAMIDSFGTSTGSARYRQLREFANFSHLPLADLPHGRVAVSNDTIDAFCELTPEKRRDLFNSYRKATSGHTLVRLSSHGMEQIVSIICQ